MPYAVLNKILKLLHFNLDDNLVDVGVTTTMLVHVATLGGFDPACRTDS